VQVHAYGISGDYDHLVASLSRIQRTLGMTDKLGVTWRARRAEQVNEILDRASVYHDDDLSTEEVVQAIQDFKGGPAGGERGDGWRGGGGCGRDATTTSGYTRTGDTTSASIEALVINSSAPLGHRTNPVGLIQACRWRGSFTVPPGSASAATCSAARTNVVLQIVMSTITVV
jgi:hypothetical protein